MKNVLALLNAILFCVMLNGEAIAAAPARVDGRNCTVADRGSETWYGFFKGNRDVFSPLNSSDKRKPFTKWRCFETEEECNSWKYWMQTDFAEGGNEAFCRQGG